MKHTIENISDVEKKISFEIPNDEIKQEIENTYAMLKKNAQIKGFRKGKIPRNILEMHFKEQVHSDVLSKIINDSYSRVLKESQLEPVSYPKFDTDKFEAGKDYTFKATIEVKPTVSIENYIGLELSKEKVDVNDKDVDKVIENLRQSQSILKLKEVDSLKKGDHAVIDIQAFQNEKSLTPDNSRSQTVEIGNKTLLPEIEEALLKLKKGEETTVVANPPAGTKKEEIKTEFKIKLKEIREKELPKVDDNFARSLGPYKDLEDLREQAKDQITKQREAKVNSKLQEDALKKLIDTNDFEIPNTLLESEKNFLLNDVKMRLSRSGLPKDKQDEEINKSTKEIEDESKRRVKQYLILDSISKKESIKVEQSDLDLRIEGMAKNMNVPVDKIKEYYGESNNLSELKSQIAAEKTLDLIIKKANIKIASLKTPKEDKDK